jgi:Zn-finger nucleic acid-binding protein
MQCPSCQNDLQLVEYEGTLIHTCEHCGGEFVGADELRHIVRTREQHFPRLMQEALSEHEPSFGVPTDETSRQLGCPACKAPMQVINYCTDTGIYVDRCTVCGGMWLDCDELEKLQVLLEQWQDNAPEKLQAIAGELEHVRRKAAERTSSAFKGSRFAFINALMNWFLDAA